MRRRVALVAALTAACTLPPPTGLEPTAVGSVAILDLPLKQPRRTDVLFIVDNSPAMRAHAANLLVNAPNFMRVAATLPGGLPDLHIAVITTDLGADGAPDDAGCHGRGDDARFRGGGFLADEIDRNGARHRNYEGPLTDAFTALVDVGATGCAFPRPFAAMRRALEDPANAGFLREDAYLSIVFVTAADDCSFDSPDFVVDGTRTAPCFTRPNALEPVADHVAFLRGLKVDPDMVLVSAIAGLRAVVDVQLDTRGAHVTPSCTFSGGSATPANRIRALLDEFPGRSTSTAICQANLSDGVQTAFGASGLPDRVVGNPCFGGTLLDTEPNKPGLQPDCRVWLATRSNASLETQLVSRCVGDPGAIAVQDAPLCWYLELAPQCTEGDHHKLRLTRWFVSGWAYVIAQCVTE